MKVKYEIFKLKFNCKKCKAHLECNVILGWRHVKECEKCKSTFVVTTDKDNYRVFVKEV